MRGMQRGDLSATKSLGTFFLFSFAFILIALGLLMIIVICWWRERGSLLRYFERESYLLKSMGVFFLFAEFKVSVTNLSSFLFSFLLTAKLFIVICFY